MLRFLLVVLTSSYTVNAGVSGRTDPPQNSRVLRGLADTRDTSESRGRDGEQECNKQGKEN